MLERLSKLIDKYELDDVANIGLESKYSINPMLIEKLLQTNNRDDVSRIGRLIGKKFALLIHLLNQVNPKIAKRLDADFMFAYKKFIPLFGFNPVEYQPNIQQQPENEPIGLAPHLYLCFTKCYQGNSSFVGSGFSLLPCNARVYEITRNGQARVRRNAP